MASRGSVINRRQRARGMRTAHMTRCASDCALILRSPMCFVARLTTPGSRCMQTDDRPTLAAPDDDPYLWLEEIEGERALAFVERQNGLTLDRFGGSGFARDRDILTAIYDRPDNIPYAGRRGGLLYNLWK